MTKRIAHGISFDPNLLEQAKEAAAADGRSLSNYVQFLVARDIEGAASKRKTRIRKPGTRRKSVA